MPLAGAGPALKKLALGDSQIPVELPLPGFNPTRALSLTWVRGPMMLHAAGLVAAVTLLGAAAVAATTPAECSRRMHGRRSLPPPPPVTPGAFDWIREIAAAGPGRKFTLQARTYLIDSQYQLPAGTELRGAGRATVIQAVGAPYNTTTPGNRKGLLLGDNTWVGGFHFIGMETKRIGFTSPVETPGCACRGQMPLAGCGSHHFTSPPNETECWGAYKDIHGNRGNGVRNATVEDITVEAYTTQNLFYMPPTQAGARVSRDIIVRGLRTNGTWADGMNVHGAHVNVLIEDSTTRCTNDDSFAVWSIGAMARFAQSAIQKGTRVLISLWDSRMFGAGTCYPPEH